MNDKKLIELVRNYPVLYDLSNSQYMDTDFKNNIWNEIGDQMKTTGRSCKTRWANIRDNFRKSIKKYTYVSGPQTKPVKLYKYSEQLSFLKNFFNERDLRSKIGDEIKNQDLSGNEENDSIESSETKLHTNVNYPVNEQSLCLSLSTPTQTDSLQSPTQSKKPKLTSQKTSSPKTAAATLIEYFIRDKERIGFPSIQSSDPVDAFLAGLAPALKRLPPRYWHYAKADIFATVQKYELKMLMEEDLCLESPADSH